VTRKLTPRTKCPHRLTIELNRPAQNIALASAPHPDQRLGSTFRASDAMQLSPRTLRCLFIYDFSRRGPPNRKESPRHPPNKLRPRDIRWSCFVWGPQGKLSGQHGSPGHWRACFNCRVRNSKLGKFRFTPIVPPTDLGSTTTPGYWAKTGTLYVEGETHDSDPGSLSNRKAATGLLVGKGHRANLRTVTDTLFLRHSFLENRWPTRICVTHVAQIRTHRDRQHGLAVQRILAPHTPRPTERRTTVAIDCRLAVGLLDDSHPESGHPPTQPSRWFYDLPPPDHKRVQALFFPPNVQSDAACGGRTTLDHNIVGCSGSAPHA